MEERILIIEDELDLLDLVDFNLTRKGYITRGALDGSEGLSLAMSFAPELVILDLMLPGIDGWQLCRLIKKELAGVRVLMLTAKGLSDDMEKGLATGADDYMTKPFSLDELFSSVERLLKGGGRKRNYNTPVTIP
ncbi:MAG: response regulator [Thermodesulfobacteriota bacterium]|nr:MAG: response regulator [Thermodesulfobacteriota bacterium]